MSRKNPKNEQQDKETAMTDEQETTVVEKKVKATPPGWRPAGQLPKLKAKAGWTCKWANPQKLTERLSEGWKVMKPEDNVGDEILNLDVNDVSSLNGSLRYRDMVAIMLPIELKKARDEWLKNENKQAMSGVLNETTEKMSENGVETYAPTGQQGKIVIN